MIEKTQLQAFLVFLFVLVVMSLSTASFAAVSLSPVVPGYNAAAGTYRAAAGSFTMAAANSGFIQPSIVNVGGKPITVPASLRMAANAGTLAKSAMRLNPWLLAGSLALPWLLDQNVEWDGSQWMKSTPDTAPVSGRYWYSSYSGAGTCWGGTSGNCSWEQAHDQTKAGFMAVNPWATSCGWGSPSGSSTSWNDTLYCNGYATTFTFTGYGTNPGQSEPMTPGDWDALPDPLPAIAPELPYAPYMPEGAPVDAPEFDFAPFNVPIGEPYTKPDGSTYQPSASVSPNGDTVTIDTYDQPLTDTQGQPVPNPTPQDTPEPQPDPCEQNPDRLGCMNAGSDNFTVPKSTINFSFTPEADVLGGGGCPAPISVLGHSLSYQPACDAMSMIRPVVLGMASIIAAYILFGAFRGVD